MSVTSLVRLKLLTLKFPKTEFINTAQKQLNKFHNKIHYSNVHNSHPCSGRQMERFASITKLVNTPKSLCLPHQCNLHTVGKVGGFLGTRLKGLILWNAVNTRYYNAVMQAFKKKAIEIVTGSRQGKLALGSLVAFSFAWFRNKHTPAPITGRRRLLLADPDQIQVYANMATRQITADFSTEWNNHPMFQNRLDIRQPPSILPETHAVYMRVKRILDTLIAANPEAQQTHFPSWTLKIVDFEQITNSEGYENGTIFISKKMCDYLDDDELAFLLGHEMAHVLICHYAESLSLKHYFMHTIGNMLVIMQERMHYTEEKMAEKADWWYNYIFLKLMPSKYDLEMEADYVGLLFSTKACFDRVAYKRMIDKWDTGVNELPGGRYFTYKGAELRAHELQMADFSRFQYLPNSIQNYFLTQDYYETDHPDWRFREAYMDKFMNQMTEEHRKAGCEAKVKAKAAAPQGKPNLKSEVV